MTPASTTCRLYLQYRFCPPLRQRALLGDTPSPPSRPSTIPLHLLMSNPPRSMLDPVSSGTEDVAAERLSMGQAPRLKASLLPRRQDITIRPRTTTLAECPTLCPSCLPRRDVKPWILVEDPVHQFSRLRRTGRQRRPQRPATRPRVDLANRRPRLPLDRL